MSKNPEITQADRLMKEKDLQRAYEDICHRYGYLVAHFRPAQTQSGNWVTAVSGDGVGFPDNVCVKSGMPVIFAELKREGQKLTPAQAMWFEVLSECPGVRCFVFYPHDFERIARVLQGKE